MTPIFRTQIQSFVKDILTYIQSSGVSLDVFEIDHVAYKNSNTENYEKVRKDFGKEVFIYESVISNRRIAISKFRDPVKVEGKIIKYIEIFEPKPDKITEDKLDHIEIISNNLDYESFVKIFEDSGVELTFEDKGYDRFYAFNTDKGYEVKLSDHKIVDKIYKEEML